MIKLINFINQHLNNWEELLAAPPYCLHIKYDDDYALIKYDTMLSDFNYEICKEACGIIIRKINDKWFVAAQGLNKFFNYDEAYSDLKEIDWNNCVVSEKIDGTNIRIYMNDGYWHVSTLGCINAFKAKFIDDITYGQLVNEACGGTIENLTSQLDPLYCYYFELTGPNKIVINYGEQPMLWYLGRRVIATSKENFDKVTFKNLNIYYPKIYIDIKSLQTCVNNAVIMEQTEEGYVVTSVDNNGEAHRIKIKGQEYLRLHKLRCNGILTITRVISMWRDSTLDDYMSAFPEYNNFIEQIFSAIKLLNERMEEIYITISNSYKDRESIIEALRAQPSPIPSYVFSRLDNKVTNTTQFIKQLSINKLASGILPYVGKFSVGVTEDE